MEPEHDDDCNFKVKLTIWKDLGDRAGSNDLGEHLGFEKGLEFQYLKEKIIPGGAAGPDWVRWS